MRGGSALGRWFISSFGRLLKESSGGKAEVLLSLLAVDEDISRADLKAGETSPVPELEEQHSN